MKVKSLTAILTLVMLLGATLAFASDQQTITINNNGEVRFTEPTVIGNDTLAPGLYRVQHRVTKGNHFLDFSQLSAGRGKVAEKYSVALKCDFNPHPVSVRPTAFVVAKVNGVQYVTRYAVAPDAPPVFSTGGVQNRIPRSTEGGRGAIL